MMRDDMTGCWLFGLCVLIGFLWSACCAVCHLPFLRGSALHRAVPAGLNLCAGGSHHGHEGIGIKSGHLAVIALGCGY